MGGFKEGMGWNEINVAQLLRVLKNTLNAMWRMALKCLRKSTVPVRTMVVWKRVLVVKIMSSEYERYFEWRMAVSIDRLRIEWQEERH